MIAAAQEDIEELKKDISFKETQKQQYEEQIERAKKDIIFSKTKVAEHKNLSKLEFEFKKRVHDLEAGIRHWKTDKDKIINVGVGISYHELEEYRNELKYNAVKK